MSWRYYVPACFCLFHLDFPVTMAHGGGIFWTNLLPFRSCPFPNFPVVSLTSSLVSAILFLYPYVLRCFVFAPRPFVGVRCVGLMKTKLNWNSKCFQCL